MVQPGCRPTKQGMRRGAHAQTPRQGRFNMEELTQRAQRSQRVCGGCLKSLSPLARGRGRRPNVPYAAPHPNPLPREGEGKIGTHLPCSRVTPSPPGAPSRCAHTPNRRAAPASVIPPVLPEEEEGSGRHFFCTRVELGRYTVCHYSIWCVWRGMMPDASVIGSTDGLARGARGPA